MIDLISQLSKGSKFLRMQGIFLRDIKNLKQLEVLDLAETHELDLLIEFLF